MDHEYGKKSITDAMTKCLSLLGVCSDVYMGEFDNKEYKELAKIEHDISKADDQEAATEQRTNELNKYVSDCVALMDLCPNWIAAQKAYAKGADKVDLLAKALKVDPEQCKAPLNAKYFELEAKSKETAQ